MFEIRGKYNTAYCYAKVAEEEAIEQIRRMCGHAFAAGSRIRIMPDGAGRIMSRKRAKETLDLEEYRRQMAGVYTTSVNAGTPDEAPMAYKALSDIIDVIADTVDVIEVLKPVYNFKADDERPRKKNGTPLEETDEDNETDD